uniref:NADH dehydrogenase subunit 4L n=1 Tax=Ferrissia californica TaxID=1776375 RepID=UPI00315CC371
MLYISGFFIMILLITFFFNKKYTLNLLIILEGMMLMSIVFSLYFLACIEDKTILMVLLTFAACEAAMGLSLLISFIRIRSNSYLNSLSLHTW